MIKDYKFKNIEKYLKKDSELGHEILDTFSSLSDAAIVFSPLVFGPQLLPLLDLLDVKDRLFNLGHKVLNFIARKIEPDYLVRIEQIEAAYALICYTSYFDLLEEAIPRNIREKLRLTFEKKKELMEDSCKDNESPVLPQNFDIGCSIYYADHITSFSDIQEQLLDVYQNVSNNLIKTIQECGAFDRNNKNEQKKIELIKSSLENLPEQAIKNYTAQYLSLSDSFNDFALFAQLKNFEGLNNAIKTNKNALDLLIKLNTNIDVGLNNLNEIVNSISTNYSKIQIQEIVDDLKKKYKAKIEEPIINDSEIKSDTENLSVKFPKIKEAFIPQSYKCFSYSSNEVHLEDKELWENIPSQNDLDKFFIKYLYSPSSLDFPLIILGHPGSGKSLLTKVLSAQLMSDSFAVIRIPLREVNAEDGIDVLVEDQIKKLTNRPLTTQGYGGFASQFNEKPLTIILDGYDELLQAKGEIFSGYLGNARRFQQEQKELDRPVRIIITSRITLIDKARVPIGSTILRLMEFDPYQRQAWINIWNNINSDYFLSAKIQPFKLPPKEKGKRNSVIELAEQPLLLLMLALYDSEKNEIAQTINLKRTDLYDNLLRRFVWRERSRYVTDFINKTHIEQEQIIDQEMNRLGVVAIGMYNRQDVVIKSKQLDEDLTLFKAHRKKLNSDDRALKESDSVLGGFFFIHQSTAKDIDAHSDHSDSAYEFLHNTFGEFLAADFILRNTINEVKSILVDRRFNNHDLENRLSNPDLFGAGWFYCLMFVPLYSRPVIIEMLREHAPKALQHFLRIYNNQLSITKNDFDENLRFFVQKQLNMILNTRHSPKVMRNGKISDRDIPLIGYLSTYSLNLIILVCTLCHDGFEFDEKNYKNNEAREKDSKPWDKLASLWKAWFSPEDLMGLSVVLSAKRKNESTVYIKCNDRFEAMHYDKTIDILLCVSSTLADNSMTGLAGIQSEQFSSITQMSFNSICEMLRNENLDLYFAYLIKTIRRNVNGFSYNNSRKNDVQIDYNNVNNIIDCIISNHKFRYTSLDSIIEFFDVLECCIYRNLLFTETRIHLLQFIPDLFDNLRYKLKKNMSPELICGVRVWRLLTKESDMIPYNRDFNSVVARDLLVESDWSNSLENSMHYLDRISIKRRILYDYEHNDLEFRRSVSYLLDNPSTISTSDKLNFFERLTKSENIDLYLKTNPELITKVVLLQIKETGKFKEGKMFIIDEFFKKCIAQLSNYGLNFFGFNAMINVIKIAKELQNPHYLDILKPVIEYETFRKRPNYFSIILVNHPRYITLLLKIYPEMFLENIHYFDKDIFRYKKVIISNYNNVFDYISCFRMMYNFFERYKMIDEMQEILALISRMINYKELLTNSIDINSVTINQLDNIIWYFNLSQNKRVSKRFIFKLKEHLNSDSNNIVFSALLDKI